MKYLKNFEQNKYRPSYFYPKEQRYSNQYEYSEEKYGVLKRNITSNLIELMKNAVYNMVDEQI